MSNTLGDLLIEACCSGDLDKVKGLIANGVNIHSKVGMFNNTPILTACLYGQLHIVKYLVENGADINIGMDYYIENNNNPLYWADFYNHIDIVKYLILNGADYCMLRKSSIEKVLKEIRLSKMKKMNKI